MEIFNTDTKEIEKIFLSDHVYGQEDWLKQIVANHDYLNGEIEIDPETGEFRACQETINWLREAIYGLENFDLDFGDYN